MERTPGAIDALIARTSIIEPDPAEVRVVLDTRHGMLVERSVDAGYVVVPSARLVARAPGPGSQGGRRRGRPHRLPPRPGSLRAPAPADPHGEAAELWAIARGDERASRDERRLPNRMRADLIATFPAVLAIAGKDMGRPASCACWNGGRRQKPWPAPR